MAWWWFEFGSECRGLSDVGQLRFSNGSDLCGMMLHDVSCGSDWCRCSCGSVLNTASGSACCGSSLHGSVVVPCWCDQYVVQMCVRV